MSRGLIVRKPLSVREHSRRAPNERVALRLPWISNLGAELIGYLAPTSRIRQAVMGRAVRQGAEAFNRRDFEAVLIGKHPKAEYHPPKELVKLGGLRELYRGHDDYLEFVNDWMSAWGEFRAEPRELIDMGERLVLVGEAIAHGQASGVPTRQTYGVVASFKDGRVIREQYFADDAQALEAVGLSE